MLPSAGYLVLAWQTDNPGVWLMHCRKSYLTWLPFTSHPSLTGFIANIPRAFADIGWHTSEGFGLQFIERYDEIAGITDSTTLDDTCTAWTDFQATQDILQEDSGI